MIARQMCHKQGGSFAIFNSRCSGSVKSIQSPSLPQNSENFDFENYFLLKNEKTKNKTRDISKVLGLVARFLFYWYSIKNGYKIEDVNVGDRIDHFVVNDWPIWLGPILRGGSIRPSNGKIFSVTVRPAKIWTQANAMLLASPQRCDPRHFAIASYETNRKINFSVLLFLNMIVWNWFKLKKSWYFLWRVHKISTDTTFIVRFFSCKICLRHREIWLKHTFDGWIQ